MPKTAALLCLLGTIACGRNSPFPTAREVAAKVTEERHFDHVILVILENEDAADVFANPYMDSLARKGVALRDYYGVAHPSYPNYMALVSGKTFIGDGKSVEDPLAFNRRDVGDAQLLADEPSLADRFESVKLTWDVFAEDYPVSDSAPARCDFSRSQGLYARKHVPFLSFKGFHDHPEWCAHVRNLKWLRPQSLGAYTMVIPNLIHDGHDAPLQTSVTWLRGFLRPILANQKLMDSTLVVVTYDESATTWREKLGGSSRPNSVYTALIGGMVKPGTESKIPYSHFSLLKTIEENFGLSPSLAPAGTNSIDDVWR